MEKFTNLLHGSKGSVHRASGPKLLYFNTIRTQLSPYGGRPPSAEYREALDDRCPLRVKLTMPEGCLDNSASNTLTSKGRNGQGQAHTAAGAQGCPGETHPWVVNKRRH